MLRFKKTSYDIQTLTQFMNEIWPIKFEYFNISKMVDRIIEEYKQTKCEQKATFIVRSVEDDAIIYCDKNYMAKAVINIIGNILRLSKYKNTTIHIDLNRTVSSIYMKIYSTRIVIDEETINNIRYANGLSIFGKKYLGLYIAENIITRHQGKFRLVSNAKVGTVITVVLPVLESEKIIFMDYELNPDYHFADDIIKAELSLL